MRLTKSISLKNGIIAGLFLAVAGLSCSKTYESSIPYRQVNLELDLSYQDKALKAVQAYKIYTQDNIDQAGELTGFGGVLVYHGLDNAGGDAYYAFDAACPYEADKNTIVAVDDDAVYAVCPKCHSRYELLNGIGNPVSGPAEYTLKSYQVFSKGSKIYVQN